MRNILLTTFSFFIINHAISQSVGIGTNIPNPSALLEINDSTRGILIPRMTMQQRNIIVNPAEGLMIYQTDGNKGFWFFDGLNWLNIYSQLFSGTSGGAHMEVFTSGNYNWIVPAGVTSVVVEMWSGGGGGAVGGYNYCGGSGGAGGYGKGAVSVIPGSVIPIAVGTGGNGCSTINTLLSCNGSNGGNTSFDNLIAVGGGGGIGYISSQGTNGTPGTCNALVNCSSTTNNPCINYLGVQYGLAGGGTCHSGPGSFSSLSGREGYLILTW